MKTIKKIALIVSAFVLLVFGVSSSLTKDSSGNKAETSYHYTILDAGSFTETVTFDKNSNPDVTTNVSYKIECFRIKDYPTYIAVAWGETSYTTQNYLRFINNYITSSKPTGESVNYTIVAVAKDGFSRCTFQQLVLPQTVVDIREEAFAYCQNLTEFQIPKGVEIISEGMFLDCRNLTAIYYSDNTGKKVGDNSVITTFGSHCFDSCVSLQRFYCPTSATSFQQSCFQKCSKLTVFKFPHAIIDDNDTPEDDSDDEITNYLTVEEYAFADCSTLQVVYFDINLTTIKNHAFADSKDDLEFRYYGTEAQFNSLSNSLAAHEATAKWRHKKITTGTDTTDPENPINYNTVVYDAKYNQKKTIELGDYSGMEFIITNEAQKLDSARTNSTSVYPIAGGGANYAIIHEFKTPDPSRFRDDYFTAEGELTIPNTITYRQGDEDVTVPVKVIDDYAFQLNNDITTVHFNKNLVQIKNHAFFHSNNIGTLDFSDCENLVEIGYALFNDVQLKSQYSNNQSNCWNAHVDGNATKDASNSNSQVHRIDLPSCLQYLGNFAFYNFTALTGTNAITFGGSASQLKVIGDYAFAVYSDGDTNNIYFNGTPATAIEVPYSLDDAAAVAANFYHSFTYDAPPSGKTVNDTIFNRCAINKNAFENQDAIYSFKMASGGSPHNISFGSNVFVRCTNLWRFESSDNLCLIGNDAFKQCEELREAFLYADRAYSNTSGTNTAAATYGTPSGGHISNPWGVLDGGNNFKREIFESQKSYYHELVIYVRTTTNNTGKYPNSANGWYTVKTDTYKNDITGANRTVRPIKYIVGTYADNIKYWHINDNTTNSLVSFANGPKTISDYKNGWISLYKNTANSYGVAKYFTDGTSGNVADVIDFSSNNDVAALTITSIDEQAFAANTARNMGRYFVLPSTITTIKDRAFFRKSTDTGVRIVTFYNGSSPQVYDGCEDTFSSITSGWADGKGYCCLPLNVTTVEKSAFYNNLFSHVELSTKVSLIYAGSFITYSHAGKITSWAFSDYGIEGAPASNSYFETDDNNTAIYYKDASNKALIQANSGDTGTLTIADDTKAVWDFAASRSKFTKIDFNDTYYVKNGAFSNCTSLTGFTDASSLKYLSYDPPANEAVSVPTTYVIPEYSSGGAFQGCTALNLDFPTQMTSIVGIGASAFESCNALVNHDNKSKTYAIYTYSSGTGDGAAVSAANCKKTLDLSVSSTLKYVGNKAFNASNITYAITPNTADTYASESKITFSGTPFNTNTKILCGETVHQADPNRVDNDEDQPMTITQAKIQSHYGTNPFGRTAYTNIYYRVHSYDDVWEKETVTKHYWTAVKTGDADQVKIILFESKTAVQNFYSSYTGGTQLDTFPEVVVTPEP